MKETDARNFLSSIDYQLTHLKSMAEKAIDQIEDVDLHWSRDTNSLSIATIMKHLSANMQSRWTDFLSTDGEKEWRRKHREDEFINTQVNRKELLEVWEKGWKCFMSTVQSLTSNHLGDIVYIRNEGYTVVEAIHSGLAHAAYHVGQIVYIAKMLKSSDWQSLSIPKGQSEAFNLEKFKQEKSRRKF